MGEKPGGTMQEPTSLCSRMLYEKKGSDKKLMIRAAHEA